MCIPENGRKNCNKRNQEKGNGIQTWDFSEMLLQQIERDNAFYISRGRGYAKDFFPDMTKEQIMYKEGECDKDAN